MRTLPFFETSSFYARVGTVFKGAKRKTKMKAITSRPVLKKMQIENHPSDQICSRRKFDCFLCSKRAIPEPAKFKDHIYAVHVKPKMVKDRDLTVRTCSFCDRKFEDGRSAMRHEATVHELIYQYMSEKEAQTLRKMLSKN